MTVRSGRRRRDLDGWPCGASVRSLVFGSPWPRTKKGGYRVVPSHRPMPRDIGTALIEPKTPVYARFEVLAFILTVPKSG